VKGNAVISVALDSSLVVPEYDYYNPYLHKPFVNNREQGQIEHFIEV